MKRYAFILVLMISLTCLSASNLTFTIENRDIDIITESNGSRVLQDNSYYSGDKQEPSIPILTHYFEIPEFTKVESVNISLNSPKNLALDKPLLKQPEQVILSKTDHINKETEVYNGNKFPETWLYNSGSSMSGSKNIAFLAIYACGYDSENKSLTLPKSFTVDITLDTSPLAKKMPDSRITREVHKQLGFSTTREFEQETLLIIYPLEFADAYIPLINHRKSQGLNVITAVTGAIQYQYEGADLAEKIRNCIKSIYYEQGVDYVTLGADVQHIPARDLWAFDCNFGLDDENNIPGDIYYANLNGDWNANQNELYGEDDDDVDLFPEVVVGRIPAASLPSEVTASIYKILFYENGEYYPDYSQGLGLSQNLWEDSNSVYVQEYMEEMYYPDTMNNVILNEAENTVANAQLNFNRNPNIIQHTGHCFWNVIALGDGTINPTFVNNMENDYAGLMYSIGCWAAALDFYAISEQLVKVPDHGITAFVGNSRYGWGAPSADGFGFSEFYQKEFTRLLFSDDIYNVAMANQLQKIPFVAYQTGTSVYKWCSYQLNTIGDSYYHFIADNPKELNVDIVSIGDTHSLYFTSNNEPVEGVVIYITDSEYYVSDSNGLITITSEYPLATEARKIGYISETIIIVDPSYETSIIEYQVPETVTPVSDRVINFKVRNGLDIDLAWELRVLESEQLIGSTSGNLTAGLVSDWLEVSFDQAESDVLTLELYSNTSNEVVDTKIVNINLAKPEIELLNFQLEPYPVAVNDYNYFSYRLKNTSAYPLEITSIEYESEDLEIGIVLPMRTTIEAGEELILDNDFMLGYEVDIASMDINVTLMNEFWPEQEKVFTYNFSVGQQSLSDSFEYEPTWFEEFAWQRTDDQAYAGDYSLTCSPTQFGEFDLDLPLLTYTDEIRLSFMYKYKMPMYGEDGFSIYVVTDDLEERIIFLGSGGALENEVRDVDDFIFSDWAEYSLTLGDILLNKPDLGSEFTLRFSFTYIQDNNVTNNYADDPNLGIFLDNMQLHHGSQEVSNDQEVEAINNHISIYPNPVKNSALSVKHNSKIGDVYEVSLYNLKGQKVYSTKGSIKSMDKDALQVPIFHNNRDKLSSGIYFLKYKSVDTSEVKKILFLK